MRLIKLNPKIIVFSTIFLGHAANAGDLEILSTSKYAEQESRSIKSLSQDDIRELKRGGGWGLAKVAELNGVPGPSHLLTLKDKLALDGNQMKKISKIYEKMRKKAIDQGELLISLEQKLENHFKNRTVTDEVLRTLLDEISDVRRQLRYTHLATHLETPNILTRHQMREYARVRGYTSAKHGRLHR